MGVGGQRIDSGFRKFAIMGKRLQIRRNDVRPGIGGPSDPRHHTCAIDRPEGVNRFAHLSKRFVVRLHRRGWHIVASDRVVPLPVIRDRVSTRDDRLSVGFANISLQPEH